MKDKVEKKKIQKGYLKEMNKKLSLLRKLHLVHVDIKPDNIFESPGWKKLVLIDFGLAIFLKEWSMNKQKLVSFALLVLQEKK